MALPLPNTVGGILFDGGKAVGSSDGILHSPETSAPAQEPDSSPVLKATEKQVLSRNSAWRQQPA